MPIEGSQIQKDKDLQEVFRIDKFMETGSRMEIARAGQRKNGKLLFNGYRNSV